MVMGTSFVYENGAVVGSAFTTNILGDMAFTTAPDLCESIERVNGKESANLPIYGYENAITTALIRKIARIEFSAKRNEVQEIANLDALKEKGKSLFGRGWLLSDRKEAERKEKERKENYLHLSEREKEIIKRLNAIGEQEDEFSQRTMQTDGGQTTEV